MVCIPYSFDGIGSGRAAVLCRPNDHLERGLYGQGYDQRAYSAYDAGLLRYIYIDQLHHHGLRGLEPFHACQDREIPDLRPTPAKPPFLCVFTKSGPPHIGFTGRIYPMPVDILVCLTMNRLHL